MPLALSWTLKYGFLFNLNRNKIIIFSFEIEFLVVDLPGLVQRQQQTTTNNSRQLGMINYINVNVYLLILIYC